MGSSGAQSGGDGEPAREYAYLRIAIMASKKVGMFPVFSTHYRSYRGMGDDVITTAWRALYDWDILDEIVENRDGSISLGLKMVHKGREN
jgi:hypothetical protein